MNKYNRVYAEIDLDAVRYNFVSMKKNIKEVTKIMAVIKADAYGHGAIPIARLMEKEEYLWGFATATAQEALHLREAGIQKPIIILGYVFEEYDEALIQQDIRPTIFQKDRALELSRKAQAMGKVLPIHLAVDTGMTRIGFADDETSVKDIKEITRFTGIKVEGLFTHFARADEMDKTRTQKQFERYLSFSERLRQAGIEIPIHHCSNSAGIIDLPQANLDVVRAGISIYGIYPSQEVKKEAVPLKPVMQIKSHISFIKEVEAGVEISYGGTFTTKRKSRIATIPVGYADGYPRSLSGKGCVLIHGQRAPITGRVCMDQFMVDITDFQDVREHDEVTLLGRSGDAFLAVEELSDLSGRFPYEFVCDISARVPRIYKKEGQVGLDY